MGQHLASSISNQASKMKDLSVIVVSFNTEDLLKKCLLSVYRFTSGLDYEVIVVDNASRDGSVQLIKDEFKDVVLIENEQNRGFSAANNQALRVARGNAVVLLNSDTELADNSLKILHDFLFSRSVAGACGGLLVYPGGAPQWSYGYYPSLCRMLWVTLSGLLRINKGRKPNAVIPDQRKDPRQVEYIVGADLMLKKEVLDKVGLLDESFFAYCEETDLCRRITEAGYEIWYTPEARIIHWVEGSFKRGTEERLRIYYTSLFKYVKKHSRCYLPVKVFLMAKFYAHAVLSGDSSGGQDARLRLRAVCHSGLNYPSTLVDNS